MNTAHVVVRDSTIDKILLAKSKGREYWELPGHYIPSGQLPAESVAKHIYSSNPSPLTSGLRLVAVLGFESFGGFSFVYNKTTGHVGDAICLPDRFEARFFSLTEIFLDGLALLDDHKRMIGAWQKQLHTNTVLETQTKNITGVVIGTEMVPIRGAP